MSFVASSGPDDLQDGVERVRPNHERVRLRRGAARSSAEGIRLEATRSTARIYLIPPGKTTVSPPHSLFLILHWYQLPAQNMKRKLRSVT